MQGQLAAEFSQNIVAAVTEGAVKEKLRYVKEYLRAGKKPSEVII